MQMQAATRAHGLSSANAWVWLLCRFKPQKGKRLMVSAKCPTAEFSCADAGMLLYVTFL